MAAAVLVFEWACEVIGTNLGPESFIKSLVFPESMPFRLPPLSRDKVSTVPEIRAQLLL